MRSCSLRRSQHKHVHIAALQSHANLKLFFDTAPDKSMDRFLSFGLREYQVKIVSLAPIHRRRQVDVSRLNRIDHRDHAAKCEAMLSPEIWTCT
jgi:hypothetical protein